MYEGDAPLAERRAALLSLDRELLADLLGDEELRELLDPEVVGDVELELQRLSDDCLARDADELHDQLRILGPLSRLELAVRAEPGADLDAWIRRLFEEQRVVEVRIAGEDRLAVSEDAARLRDGAGAEFPAGIAGAFAEPGDDPLGDLCLRFSRTHGPFVTSDIVRWIGVGEDQAGKALQRLMADGKVIRGEFRRGSGEREYCNDDVLRLLRRRSLAVLRNEIEPVSSVALVRFLGCLAGLDDVPRCGVDGFDRGGRSAAGSANRCVGAGVGGSAQPGRGLSAEPA